MLYYLKLLLWPFALLYGEIMTVRNLLYNKGVLPSRKFNLPVIAVGNLTVGGTGKTPHVEYLLRILKKYQRATLSRGYKRKTKGFVLADETATALTVGDEPFQYYLDFPEVTVAVCEDRVEGVKQLLDVKQDLDVIILDDAMQHRPLHPSLNLLITDYNRPFYKDLVMPAGLLREPANGAVRADVIIISKCPSALPESEQKQIVKSVNKYASHKTPVFFTTFKYGTPVSIGKKSALSANVVLLTGIANDAPLQNFLSSQGFRIIRHFNFPDHYNYTFADLKNVEDALYSAGEGNAVVITTRKDAVKLLDKSLKDKIRQLPVFYIPIEVSFIHKEDVFDQLILQHVEQFRHNSPPENERIL